MDDNIMCKNIIRNLITQWELDMTQLKSKKNDWEFQQISYYKWAGKEILERMHQWPERDPLTIVYDFLSEMSNLDKDNIAHAFQFESAFDAGIMISDEINYYFREKEKVS